MARARKPPRGRPSLGDAALGDVLSIKVNQTIRAQWQAAADREGLTLGAWLREAADLALARGSTR